MSSKLVPPNVEHATLRPRLFDWLDRARERPVIWVAGPAGAGKSTLVASYVRARALRCLWYSVDARDADPGALFYYLARAAAEHGKPGAGSLPLLATDHPVGGLGFARRYFEALFEQIEKPALLVFDDCPPPALAERWYALVREGCAAVPAGINVVFVSRSGPAPVLARLLASSKLSMIDWDELRFSADEATTLAHAGAQRLELGLGLDEIAALARDFEGWAAGIVLALECARRERRLTRPSFEVASQQLFDYFAAEVMGELESELRLLLLKSAFLPVLTDAAFDRMLDGAEGARHLARLKSANLFLQEHRTSPVSYRYHPLFRSFLVTEARRELGAAAARELELRAAHALAEVGETEAALELFLEAGDFAMVSRLVVEHAQPLMRDGRSQTIQKAIERLPAREFEENPWLCYWAGIANLGSQPSRAVDFARRAFQSFVAAGETEASRLSCCALVHAYTADGDDLRRLGPLLERLHAAVKEPSVSGTAQEAMLLRTAALGMTMLTPQDPRAREYLERVLALPYREPEELALALFSFGFHGEARRFSEIIAGWDRRVASSVSEAPAQLWLRLSQVFHALMTGQFARVQGIVSEALHKSERAGWFVLDRALLAYSAYSFAPRDDRHALRLAVDDLAEIAESGGVNDLSNYCFCSGLEALLSGDLVRARRSMEDAVEHASRLGAPLASCLHRLGLAEVLTLSGELDAAEQQLSYCAGADAISRIVGQSERLLRASVFLAAERKTECDEQLAAALASGAEWGFVPVAVPTRRTLKPLLSRAIERNIEKAYALELTDRFEFSDPAPTDGSVRASGPPAAAKVPAEFAKALRAALRRLHETHRLTENPLLYATLVESRVGHAADLVERVGALRQILHEGIAALATNARTEPLHTALFHTYLEPAPTQLLAAESARMSFGTYRRNLAAGLEALSMSLWFRAAAVAADP